MNPTTVALLAGGKSDALGSYDLIAHCSLICNEGSDKASCAAGYSEMSHMLAKS